MDGGDHTTAQRRYTRKDLSKLPRGFLKMRTPEEIDNLFDKDGFMLPAVAGVIDTGLGEQVCFVCSKPSKSYCSSCKSVLYCSRECQKSHWKTHKAMCGIMKDPHPDNVQRTVDAANPDSEIAKHERLSTEMFVQGREFANVAALLGEWFQDKVEYCPRGGNLATLALERSHMFTLARNEQGMPKGKLVLVKEMWHKPGRSPRPQDQKFPSPQEQVDVCKYITSSLETMTRGLKEARLVVFGDFWTTPPWVMDEYSRQQGITMIRRGAEIILREDGGLRVVQLQPEILKQKDALTGPEGAIKKIYRW